MRAVLHMMGVCSGLVLQAPVLRISANPIRAFTSTATFADEPPIDRDAAPVLALT